MRLQTAVDTLGDDNSPEAKMLRDALKKAQQEATMAPVGVRLDACAQFVERARNRLSRADEALRKAQDEREVGVGVEGWRTALRVEASEQRTPPAGGLGDEISKMQKLVTELNQIAAERDALSQVTEPVVGRRWSTRFEQRPSIARHQAIEEWTNARNCDLWDALEFRSADAGVEHAGTRSIKNGDIKQGSPTCVGGTVHERPDLSWDSHLYCDRCGRRQAEVSRRGRALSSPSTMKTRCRRGVRRNLGFGA